MKRFWSFYHPRFAQSLVYMLQGSEYHLGEYLAWFWRAPDFSRVAHRKRLVYTRKASLLLATAYVLVLLLAIKALSALYAGLSSGNIGLLALALIVALGTPYVVAYGLTVPLWLGTVIVQRPRERRIIQDAERRIASHPAVRVGIAGSYGKTSFKEILRTILSAGQTVTATPGNMNTPLGISRFMQRVTGHEDVLIFELGEYYPGDVRKLCALTQPSLGVITGINESHLSKFKTLAQTTRTIFELADYLKHQPVYKNAENDLVAKTAKSDDPLLYSRQGVGGWKVSHIKVALTGTTFTARKGKREIEARTGLLGVHNVGPLVAAIDIAERLGLDDETITEGIRATVPFEHRMAPRRLDGSWLIDDTYNGNLDGVRAGIELLSTVDATRRIYVTPGLVEQGDRTQAVHEEIGRIIAPVADVVVLMQNSVTEHIVRGLTEAKFTGELRIEPHPLKFYTNIEHFVAHGDVVLMQNDWSDAYS